ncbi:MAG: hypothetical protein K2L91_04850 [Duncaniella sp.]|nr:hypothetical protein [Duncaniella sp.]
MRRVLYSLAAVISLSALNVAADTPSLNEAVEAARKAPKNQALNRVAADLLKDAGRYAESITYYMKSGNSGNLGAAEASYYMYDFEGARDYLDKYLAKRSKAEAERDNKFVGTASGEMTDWTDFLSARISLGRSMLDRVENIEVIDSINVPADGFFEFVRLAGSAGSLVGMEEIEKIVSREDMAALGVNDIMQPGFVTERGDEMIWVGSDSAGNSVMIESYRLADGSWDKPVKLFDYSGIFGNNVGSWVDYPFLLNDGVTLYFASDGDESLGQLDIFMTRRDENEFLQPSNIGMPYNSPFNDYLYAVDEETGAGWWVTDRNRVPDSVTIYTFIPKEIRENYPVDTPDLASRARVSSIADTWQEGKDYDRLRRSIASVGERRAVRSAEEFDFQLPDGRVLHRISDFHAPMARTAMKNYLKEKAHADSLRSRLAAMRADYARGDHKQASEILRLEKSIEQLSVTLRSLANEVITLEM